MLELDIFCCLSLLLLSGTSNPTSLNLGLLIGDDHRGSTSVARCGAGCIFILTNNSVAFMSSPLYGSGNWGHTSGECWSPPWGGQGMGSCWLVEWLGLIVRGLCKESQMGLRGLCPNEPAPGLAGLITYLGPGGSLCSLQGTVLPSLPQDAPWCQDLCLQEAEVWASPLVYSLSS